MNTTGATTNNILFTALIIAVLSTSSAYAGVRSAVNNWWFEFYTGGRCNDPKFAPARAKQALQSEELTSLLQATGNLCDCAQDNSALQRFLNNADDFQERVFFDWIAQNQIKESSCELKYWDLLDASKSEKLLSQGNAQIEKLKKIYPQAQISSNQPSTQQKQTAYKVQEELVRQMITNARQIRQLDEDIKSFGKENENTRTYQKLNGKRNILYNATPFIGEKFGKDFFNKYVLDVLKKNPDITNEALSKSLLEGPNSFQNKIVEHAKQNVLDDLTDFASMNHDYTHSFKVNAMKTDLAASILYAQNSAESKNFAGLVCNLEAKYGAGSDVSYWSNNLGVSVISTAATGGAAAATALAKAGMITVNTGRMIAYGSAISQTVLNVADLAGAVVTQCTDGKPAQLKSGICGKVEEMEKIGSLQFTRYEQESTNCALNVTLSALGLALGGLDFKSARYFERTIEESKVLKTIRNEIQANGGTQVSETMARRILQATSKSEGYRADMLIAMKSISDNQSLPKKLRKEIVTELSKAVAHSEADRIYPNLEFLTKAKSTEDFAYVNGALKKINDTNGSTWFQRFKNWISKLNLKKAEKDKLENCMISSKGASVNGNANRGSFMLACGVAHD